MDRVDGPCFTPTRCSDLSGNGVTQSNQVVPGAAVWAESGADVEIYQTIAEGNYVSPSSDNGSVFFATGVGSTLTVEGVRLWNNQEADALFEGQDFAQLSIAFVTASRNLYDGEYATSPIALTTNATATLNSSVFYPNLPVFLGSGGALSEVDCLILSNTSGLPGGATFISTSRSAVREPHRRQPASAHRLAGGRLLRHLGLCPPAFRRRSRGARLRPRFQPERHAGSDRRPLRPRFRRGSPAVRRRLLLGQHQRLVVRGPLNRRGPFGDTLRPLGGSSVSAP